MINLKEVAVEEYNDFLDEYLKKDSKFSKLQTAHVIVCFLSLFVMTGIAYLATLPYEAFLKSHTWVLMSILFIVFITPFWLSPIFDKFELKMAKDIYEWEKDMGYFVIYNPYFIKDEISLPVNFKKNVLKDNKYFRFQLFKSSNCYVCKTLIEDDAFDKYTALFEKALKENYEYLPLFSDSVFVFNRNEISELLNPNYEVYELRR